MAVISIDATSTAGDCGGYNEEEIADTSAANLMALKLASVFELR